MRNLALALAAVLFVLFCRGAVAQPLMDTAVPERTASSPLDAVNGVGRAFDDFNNAMDRLLNPNRDKPKPPARHRPQPKPEGQPDPVKKAACEAALEKLKASLEKYFQAAELEHGERRRRILNREKNTTKRQSKLLSLARWWQGVQADQKKIGNALKSKIGSCSDTKDHPVKAWTLEEGDRINSQDSTQLADVINHFIWNPPPSGALRSDELLTLIREPRILP